MQTSRTQHSFRQPTAERLLTTHPARASAPTQSGAMWRAQRCQGHACHPPPSLPPQICKVAALGGERGGGAGQQQPAAPAEPPAQLARPRRKRPGARRSEAHEEGNAASESWRQGHHTTSNNHDKLSNFVVALRQQRVNIRTSVIPKAIVLQHSVPSATPPPPPLPLP